MDHISSLLTCIRNGQGVKLLNVKYNKIKLCTQILDVLIRKGFIRGYKVNNNTIEILLKYFKGFGVIKNIQRVSKPGNKVYISSFNLWKMQNLQNKILILSTNHGILTHNEALEKRIGGEVILKID